MCSPDEILAQDMMMSDTQNEGLQEKIKGEVPFLESILSKHGTDWKATVSSKNYFCHGLDRSPAKEQMRILSTRETS